MCLMCLQNMNAFDRLHYYENFYDSFCSEFAIPRAHTSHSYSRPSSVNGYTRNNHQFDYETYNRRSNNGKFSNNVYYFDTFSDAFAAPQQEEDQIHQELIYFNPANRSLPPCYQEYSAHELNELFNGHDSCQPLYSASLFNVSHKKRGPTPPPKPCKLKQILDYHPPPPPPTDDFEQSIPDFFQDMDSTRQSFLTNPNGVDQDARSGGDGTAARYFHQSFESIASCPIPPPPKCIQAANNTRHMSVERFPPYNNDSQYQQQHRREPMSLSEFLKLTSNTVFKKPPFSGKKHSSSPLLPCGHIINNSENATSSASPTPSASSSGEGGQNRSNGDGGRHSVLTFRKKCGVTKRRKKIDELLFEPTNSGSSELLATSSQNNSAKCNNNNSIPNANAIIAADSSHYSITNAAASPTHSIIMMAETNHDTEFELDPLPEKDCDDVLDFTWTLSPVIAPDEMVADGDGSSKRKQNRRKSSNSSTTGGNGRPSSRCSLIINSLMGHLSGLAKTTQEQPQESHHQYSSNNNTNNNNNFAHLLDHRHNNHHDYHHQNPQEEYDDHHNPGSKKFDSNGRTNKKNSTEKRASSISDSFTAVASNSHNHASPRGDPDPNGNDYRFSSKKGQQRSSSSEMLLIPAMASSTKTNETDAQIHYTGNIRQRPRSIAAFNLDSDAIESFDNDHTSYGQYRKKSSLYPERVKDYERRAHHYSSDINFFVNEENGTHNDDSFSGLGNVIGCIPRVSLSNPKPRHVQHRNDAFNHLKPKFVVGGGNPVTHNTHRHQHFECATGLCNNVAQQESQRTCSGLFCVDDDCRDDDDDKYDKYYGQYSLTGLNIPMLASSSFQPHSNVMTAAKSAEELVLDRYYAHCNKIVRNKHPPPPVEKENKKHKKKIKCGTSIFNKGKRTCSLPEKIWKNVSLPLISSTNSSNNNNSRNKSSLLCDHHKAKQIEECVYCINEQQRMPINQHKSSAGKSVGRERRKTVEPLFQLETQQESCNHRRHHHQRSVRELLGNSKGQGSEEQRVLRLKKLARSGNNNISSEQKQDRNVSKFLHRKQSSQYDHDAIGELSSSSLSSTYTTTAAVSVHRALVKRNKKQGKCTVSGSRCLNNLSSSSEESCEDEGDEGYDDGRRTTTTIAAASLKGVGVQSKRKSLSCENFIRAEKVDDDYDIDVGQGQLTVKVKPPTSKRKEKGDISRASGNPGEPRRRHCNNNNNSFGAARVSRSTPSIINGCELEDDNDVIRVKSSREDTVVHLSKLKRNSVGMNPIGMADEDVITEDSSGGSSTISSLPTSPTSTSSCRHRQTNADHINDVVKDKEKGNGKTAGTKNRVKWTFLTSGLAKATRKLSSGSSRSSLSSVTTSSDSGASSRSGGSQSSKKESSENASTSGSCASSGIEVGRKSGKNKSAPSSSNVIKTTFLKKQSGRDIMKDGADDDAIHEKPNKMGINANTRRRITAEVLFNDTAGKTSISTSKSTIQQRTKSSLLVAPNRTESLRRRPSYSTKRQRPFTVQAAPTSTFRKKPVSLGQADVISPAAPSVFLRKPPRFPHLTRVVSAPVDSRTLNNNNSVFSAFSNASCNSCGSGSNRSSTSGYTSNVSRRTSQFLKSFRKRWAKKNNKVADGDEEDAACRTKRNDDDDDDDDNDDGDIKDGDNKNGNNHCHYQAHEKVQKAATTPHTHTTTTPNRLSLMRRKRRSNSRASKHAIFSTFYIGPAIKDPMEEEKIYVTKDFDDVTLDLQSGEVKKTCDGTLLFTADPLCFDSKNKLKRKSKKLKLKMEKQIKQEKEKKEEGVVMKAEVHQKKEKASKDDRRNGKKSRGDFKKKSNNAIIHDDDDQQTVVINSSSSRKSGDDANLLSNNNNTKKADDGNSKKMRSEVGGKSCGATTMAASVTTTTTAAASGKRNRLSAGSGLIKRGFGISKDFLVGGTNGKNQSADDVSGNGAGDENAPDTPTRGSSGILGRLRDSSRSGFGFSSSGSGNGAGSSRSSSKKRSSSKHDTVNTTGGSGGFEVSQTDSPTAAQNRNSLSDSARGNTDDANDQDGVGVSTKLSTGHNHHQHQPSCSSEEELTSINSCDNRLSSLTLGGGSDGGEGEYNGPFQGRAVALVDCTPSPYDRHALRYKKGDVIKIISKKQTGLWTGKVNKQIGSFKFINVKLLQNPSCSSAENYDVDCNQRRVGGEADDDNDVEEDDIIDGDDSAGDYADPSNYQCSLHNNGRGNNANASAGVGEECSCPPPTSRRRNDPQHHQSPGVGTRQCRGNSKRLAGALNPWDVAAEQRQSVANVINGYGVSGSSNKDKRSKERGMYHGDPLGIMNADEEDEDDEDDGNEEEEENDEEIVDDDEEVGDSEDEDASLEADGMPNQTQFADKDVKRQPKSKARSNRAKPSIENKDGNQENDEGVNTKAVSGRRQNKKQGSAVGKGRPKTVGDLLKRINLEQYTLELEKHGFESLDLLKELEEEDLDTIGIVDGADRTKILTAVELLREWDIETDRIPGQTYYQYKYYLTTQRAPKAARGITAAGASGNGGGGSQTLGPNPNNMSSRVMGQQQLQQQGSPAQILQPGLTTTTTNTGMPSPHFYRLHHPRDSGIFVGKVDGEEDGDEPISGADLSCAESHPDAETEEIILSPINLQKTSSSSVGVAGGGGGAASANPNATWHSNHHHNNNNKQGSHHHINRFISKGAPAGIIPTSNNASTSNTTVAGTTQTAQQPTSSASSSGSSSSSSGIATTGDSFWNSVSSSNNSNGSGGSSASSGGGAGTSSIVVDQNHTQWTKQQQQARDHQNHPSSSGTHHRKRDASPACNTDSVRNRFLQAKSLFETSNNCSGGGGSNAPAAGGKPIRAPGHVYENGGAVLEENGSGSSGGVMESQPHHLLLQRGASQGKSLAQQQQQQQNRFLYCEKSSDSGISVCTNSPPPLRNEFRN